MLFPCCIQAKCPQFPVFSLFWYHQHCKWWKLLEHQLSKNLNLHLWFSLPNLGLESVYYHRYSFLGVSRQPNTYITDIIEAGKVSYMPHFLHCFLVRTPSQDKQLHYWTVYERMLPIFSTSYRSHFECYVKLPGHNTFHFQSASRCITIQMLIFLVLCTYFSVLLEFQHSKLYLYLNISITKVSCFPFWTTVKLTEFSFVT